jgi:hypothetical protein
VDVDELFVGDLARGDVPRWEHVPTDTRAALLTWALTTCVVLPCDVLQLLWGRSRGTPPWHVAKIGQGVVDSAPAVLRLDMPPSRRRNGLPALGPDLQYVELPEVGLGIATCGAVLHGPEGAAAALEAAGGGTGIVAESATLASVLRGFVGGPVWRRAVATLAQHVAATALSFHPLVVHEAAGMWPTGAVVCRALGLKAMEAVVTAVAAGTSGVVHPAGRVGPAAEWVRGNHTTTLNILRVVEAVSALAAAATAVAASAAAVLAAAVSDTSSSVHLAWVRHAVVPAATRRGIAAAVAAVRADTRLVPHPAMTSKPGWWRAHPLVPWAVPGAPLSGFFAWIRDLGVDLPPHEAVATPVSPPGCPPGSPCVFTTWRDLVWGFMPEAAVDVVLAAGVVLDRAQDRIRKHLSGIRRREDTLRQLIRAAQVPPGVVNVNCNIAVMGLTGVPAEARDTFLLRVLDAVAANPTHPLLQSLWTADCSSLEFDGLLLELKFGPCEKAVVRVYTNKNATDDDGGGGNDDDIMVHVTVCGGAIFSSWAMDQVRDVLRAAGFTQAAFVVRSTKPRLEGKQGTITLPFSLNLAHPCFTLGPVNDRGVSPGFVAAVAEVFSVAPRVALPSWMRPLVRKHSLASGCRFWVQVNSSQEFFVAVFPQSLVLQGAGSHDDYVVVAICVLAALWTMRHVPLCVRSHSGRPVTRDTDTAVSHALVQLTNALSGVAHTCLALTSTPTSDHTLPILRFNPNPGGSGSGSGAGAGVGVGVATSADTTAQTKLLGFFISEAVETTMGVRM